MSLKQYYVYELRSIDSNSSSVFYVGKGSGSRVTAHSRVVRKKLKNGEVLDNDKERHIAEIIKNAGDGDRLQELIIGRYETEEQALAVEATLIKWIYGQELSNLVEGHGHVHIRPKENHEFDDELDTIPSTRQRAEDKIAAINLEDVGNDLRKKIQSFGLTGLTELELETGGQDYTFSWPVPNTEFRLQLKLQFGSDRVVINARPREYQNETKNRFIKISERAGYVLSYKSGDVFAALAEFSRKGCTIDTAKSLQYPELAGYTGSRLGSFNKGFERHRVEEMVCWMQDFQIRILLAEQLTELSGDVDISKLEDALNIFRARPQSKRWRKGEFPKELII